MRKYRDYTYSNLLTERKQEIDAAAKHDLRMWLITMPIAVVVIWLILVF